MKAVQIVKTGPPESLKIVDIPIPVPQEHEILIKVYAAGVNFADVLARQGLYAYAPERPFIPGYEVAGTVAQIGNAVEGFQEGQRIAGFTDFGGYAEYAVCRADLTRPLHEPFSYTQGASIPLNWVTAYHSLYFTGPLEKGYRVLIHAAAGGVGLAAVQLLKHAGCFVIGTAGTDEKAAFLKKMGADIAINYRSEDFSRRIITETGKRSIDIIIDSLGGEHLKKEWKLLRTNGRIISLGIASFVGKNKLSIWWKASRQFKTSILHLLGNSHGVYGINMRRILARRPDLAGRAFDEIMKLFNSGVFTTVIDSAVPLEKAHEAHARLESRQSIGKVVLTNEH